MRLHRSIFCLLFLLGNAGFARGQAAQATKDSLIKNIRAVYQRINSDTALRIVSFGVEEKRHDHFMAEEIDEAYIRELLDISPYVRQLRKHLKKKV